MSKWRKALKNNRRFDARYFLNERAENQEVVENSVQQEEVKRNFHDFSFDSWLMEAEEAIDEAHCTSKRDDRKKNLEEEDLDEMHCTSKRDDEKLKKEQKKDCKPDYPDLNNNDDKEECISDAAKDKAAMKNEAVEDLEELQLGGDPKPDGREVKGMTPEEVRMAKSKEKMDMLRKASRDKPPVKKDIKRGLEESEIEEG